MQKRHLTFIAVVVSVLVAGMVGYGACMIEIDDSGSTLGEIPGADAGMPELPPDVEDPIVDGEEDLQGLMPGEIQDPPPPPGAPASPDFVPDDDGPPEMEMPGEAPQDGPTLATPTECGAVTCAADEFCCIGEGACFPRSCIDCCTGADRLRPGPTENPFPQPNE